jgi:hypothetical protein
MSTASLSGRSIFWRLPMRRSIFQPIQTDSRKLPGTLGSSGRILRRRVSSPLFGDRNRRKHSTPQLSRRSSLITRRTVRPSNWLRTPSNAVRSSHSGATSRVLMAMVSACTQKTYSKRRDGGSLPVLYQHWKRSTMRPTGTINATGST